MENGEKWGNLGGNLGGNGDDWELVTGIRQGILGWGGNVVWKEHYYNYLSATTVHQTFDRTLLL